MFLLAASLREPSAIFESTAGNNRDTQIHIQHLRKQQPGRGFSRMATTFLPLTHQNVSSKFDRFLCMFGRANGWHTFYAFGFHLLYHARRRCPPI